MELIAAGTIFVLTIVFPITQNTKSTEGLTFNSVPKTDKLTTPTPSPNLNPTIIHMVKEGETFDSIATKYYGSGKFWIILWNDNDWIENPVEIHKGWELKIRNNKPEKIEKLAPKLSKIYDELNPSPTLTPVSTIEVVSSSNSSAKPSSFDDIYKQAGTRFGVPWEILYGIHLTETGLRDGAITSGYGTGAQGPMQFLQQTFNSYAIDGNGDGVPDINNAIDAIFTAANYLAAHGGIEQGLRSYGGDITAIVNAARSRGWNQ